MTLQVPPCHHIAHTDCLESWAAIKMEWCAYMLSRVSAAAGLKLMVDPYRQPLVQKTFTAILSCLALARTSLM